MARRWLAAVSLMALMGGLISLSSQTPGPSSGGKPTTIYLVATSHLDSQWNWTVQDSIRQFVPSTFFENFQRFEKYPDYVFSYEGAIHYMWFKEYHPEAWPTLQKYVAAGRWRLAGSWINAVDTNVPSPESLMRQALYGEHFFRQEFGKVSRDVYLPDCFGFGFALPSIAVHSGLRAFTTQKLTWGSSYGIPFPVGLWKGTDGSTLVAALNPGDYVTKLRDDISVDPKFVGDATDVGDRRVGVKLFGTGDTGGAPDEESVGWLEKSLATPGGATIKNVSPDEMSATLTPAERSTLPVYEGELTMKTHGVGCYTSQAAMKRFNRENELLGDSAERAAVVAGWLTGAPYPTVRLRDAWTRVLWHQFHDDLTGTCIPQAYQFSWNDELVSSNQFAGVLTSATSQVAAALDTTGRGIPLVVFNPVSTTRREPVEATVHFPNAAPAAVRVVDADSGRDVISQVLGREGGDVRLLLDATLPPVGMKVFRVVPATAAAPAPAGSLRVTSDTLENARYRVRLDADGDIASLFDKTAGHELLRAPIRLEMRDDPSPDKPAWRILWETVNAPVREFVAAPRMRILERGPLRASIEVTRTAAGSTFVERVMLTEEGDRVDVADDVDWRSPNTLLKVAFPFAASNPRATYDLGLGTISRGNNTPDHYEVPAQWWADLTDSGGAFGAAVLDDSKYGWDKPADNILRLTLLHTAKARAYPYQSSNDLGHHQFTYAIAGHDGDWRDGRVPERAAALNRPLTAFQATPHAGAAGHAVSLITVDAPDGEVSVKAVKHAEDSDEIVVRVQEMYGRPAQARLTFAAPLTTAREINAAEEPVGALPIDAGGIRVTLTPYQPRTFALRLGTPATATREQPVTSILPLTFTHDAMSMDDDRADGDADGRGRTLAGELVPAKLEVDGIPFAMGSPAHGARNVVVPVGQTVALPPGTWDRVIVLASAVGGDVPATFTFEGAAPAPRHVVVREWQGPIGQWDSRLKAPHLLQDVYVPQMTRGQSWAPDEIQKDLVVQYDVATGVVSGIDRITPGFVKREELAWVGTHRHDRDGNEPYIASYIFAYALRVPRGARTLRLPNDPRLRMFAATAVGGTAPVVPARVLYAALLKDFK